MPPHLLGEGPSARPLRQLIEAGNFMNQWDVKMRYAKSDDVKKMPIDIWAEQARHSVTLMDA
jgi:hypothetical protein